MLVVGPVIPKDFTKLLMEGIQHKIVTVRNIIKMYRQIMIADTHRLSKNCWNRMKITNHTSYLLSRMVQLAIRIL